MSVMPRSELMAHKVDEACSWLAKDGRPADQSARMHLTKQWMRLMDAVGQDRFAEMPVRMMVRFEEAAVSSGQESASLLQAVDTAFMHSYGCPKTTARAAAIFNSLLSLASEASQHFNESDRERRLRIAGLKLNEVISSMMFSGHLKRRTYQIVPINGELRLYLVRVDSDRNASGPVKDVSVNRIPEGIDGYKVNVITVSRQE